jgi:hypothetical protein
MVLILSEKGMTSKFYKKDYLIKMPPKMKSVRFYGIWAKLVQMSMALNLF